MPHVWEKCDEVFTRFVDSEPGGTARILIEVWPDSGRLIWVLSRRRELARLVLKIPALELDYHRFLEKEEEFEAAYSEAVSEIIGLLAAAIKGPELCPSVAGALTVVASDCDDRTSEATLFTRPAS